MFRSNRHALISMVKMPGLVILTFEAWKIVAFPSSRLQALSVSPVCVCVCRSDIKPCSRFLKLRCVMQNTTRGKRKSRWREASLIPVNDPRLVTNSWTWKMESVIHRRMSVSNSHLVSEEEFYSTTALTSHWTPVFLMIGHIRTLYCQLHFSFVEFMRSRTKASHL